MGRRLRGKRKTHHGRDADPVGTCSAIPDGSSIEVSINSTSNLRRCPRLQPITSFSSISGLSNVVLPAGTNRANVIANNSSVIEILVQLLCHEREPDPDRRKLLFQALCKVIKQWNSTLYIPLHSISELHDFQTGLLKKFEFLFNEIQNQIHSDLNKPSLQLPPSGSPLTQLALTDTYQYQFLDDRYSREFTEISPIGKGGFGSVVKARSKLDGCDYAIKIIIMDKKDNQANQKTLREVQALAQLDHPNIVRYHTTWLQLYRVPPHHWPQNHSQRRFTKPVEKVRMNNFFPTSQVRIQELSSLPEPEDIEESSGGIVFADASKSKSHFAQKVNVCDTISETGESSFDSRTCSSVERNGKIIQRGSVLCKDTKLKLKISPTYTSSESTQSRLVSSEHSWSILSTDSSFSKITIDKEESVCGKKMLYPSQSSSLMLYSKHPREAQMTLFIQMGLCRENLAEWISKRNAQQTPGHWLDSVDPKLCMEIFRQLILAVQYIHSKNIIHRDLKPPNVFFIEEGKRIQLGDFGLARFMPDVPLGTDGSSAVACFTPLANDTSNTGGVGTPIYAPPEVKFGGFYGKKSDLYNLGIILLELFHPFQTGSERVKVISDLKDKQYIDPELKHRWPEIASWILKLTDPDQTKRLTAAALLELMSSRESLIELECYSNCCKLEKHIDNNSVLQEAESVGHHFQSSENETLNSYGSLNSRFNNLKVFQPEELESGSHPPGSESKPIDLRTLKIIVQENKNKDEEIKKLREENRKLHEMVAQLKEQMNQSAS